MSKRWTIEDDEFLAAYHEIGADYVASHDLGHHGKGAGVKHIKRLKETGVWDKLLFAQAARRDFVDHWLLAFGGAESKALAAERLAGRALGR